MYFRWWLAGVVLVGVASAIYFAPSRVVTSAQYVDPALCAQCHPKVWDTYRRSGMARSFYRPSHDNTAPVTFYHRPSESYFTMFERDGKFYQGRYQTGFDGKETNRIEKEIDYVIGSGNNVRTYLHRTSRNTLVELPLAWYAEKGGTWAMNAGYDRPDHAGFSRNVTYGCMFCHNGVAGLADRISERGAEPLFPEHLPEGIDCQRCHGPGSLHVKTAQRTAIVNPARLDADRQMEVCMQCHLETTSSRLPNSIVRFERGPFSYKAGEPLADFMLHFDKPADDRFEIAGAAYRLRQSACFLKSGGALRCTTCHNPHDVRHGEAAAQTYVKVCQQCHTSGEHMRSGDCLECHMPKRRTDDVVHAVMTDHYIQRRKPSRDLLAPIAERRETDANAYRGKVVLYYPPKLAQDRDRELYTAVAQVSQDSNLAEGIGQLSAAIEKYRPDRMEYYLQLADALRDSGQMVKALPFYEEAARRKPDSPIALQRLGFALKSAEALKRALEVSPADAATWHQLGLVYLSQGSRSEAVGAFEKAIRADPDMAEAWNSLGGVRLESGDVPNATAAFREAIRIQTDYAEARANLGNALSLAGKFPEARFQFEAGLRFKPDYAAGRYNYGVALARANHLDEAQRQIETALKYDSGIAEAHDLLGNLLLEKGKVQAAIDQYREAIRIRPNYGRAQSDLAEALRK